MEKWTEEQRTLALIIIDVEEAAVLARSSTTICQQVRQFTFHLPVTV